MTQQGMFGATGSGDTSGYGGLVRSVASAGSSSRPFGSYFDDVADSLERAYPAFSDAIEKIVIDRDELTMHVRANRLLEVAKILRDEPSLRFEMCLGVSGAHYPAETGRELHAIFPLLSLTHNRRIRLEVSIPDANPHMPSVVSIWAGNNWHERETFDMFGIIFDGHPGLTRILMPDDWAGHPQRKDYALGGIPVEYKGATVPPPSERRAYR
ncbi:unannotated protein [freshwater metagenome]|uniref:Unannotated protein n=1 Tax=freshwater metagenome TaxID=449393 RepID=A0A6J7BDU6_9ZZZZ|nr:NADH-quinone oxidoreductase subunit C [Actinomycetota bacterium]MSY51111.1 NADH-quinone oxidoreductase subunit C [Actinomycetota bacterium]MSY87119.1 NADH-quinone oxidoreductase subunit C [Actinomycetota bacterium]MTA51143.1 NADH-quinone oxidoreductase subunit C [Actinomycetota bacterium]